MFYTISTNAMMFFVSFLLLGCLNFATSTKPKIFTITSPTTLQRQLENISYEQSNPVDEAFLKNTLLSTLQTNETALSENKSPVLEASARVELRDTYISFGNISGMLTNVTYVDFFQLAQSTVDIIMKVEEGPDHRKIQINSTITTEKMTLLGNVTLLGSDYRFTIELSNPTFHWNKHISEGNLTTKTNHLENFTFDVITTSLQPKDFKSFLIGKSGLAENILQRMADSWLPSIAESLQNSNFYKIQNYETKLRSDTTSFEYKICRWVKNQRVLNVKTSDSNFVPNWVHHEYSTTINTESYKSCRVDFYNVKKTNNILISLRVTYESGAYVSTKVTEVLVPTEEPTITTRRSYDYYYWAREESDRTTSPAPIPEPVRNCTPTEIYAIEAKIELQLEEGTNKISNIGDTNINLLMENSVQYQDCLKLLNNMNPKSWLTSILQKELKQYLKVLLLNHV